MTKREIIKTLKQEKLFGKFCMGMCNVYWRDRNPKDMIEEYLRIIGQDIQTSELINAVKSWDVETKVTLI